MKRRLKAATRIALAMSMWSTATLLALRVAGIFHDGHQPLLESRTRLCEAVAIGCSEFVSRDDWDGAKLLLGALVARNEEVVSAGLRRGDGELAGEFGPHSRIWSREAAADLPNNCIYVPVVRGEQSVGRVEVSFEPLARAGLWGFFQLRTVQVMLIAAGLNFGIFAVFLHYCLQTLNPDQVVPGRVRSALDTVAESLVILDNRNQIALVNQAFVNVAGGGVADLLGRRIDSLQWQVAEGECGELPWQVGEGVAARPCKVWLERRGRTWTFIANAATIYDDTGASRGRLVSLNDITELEGKQAELQCAMQALRQSQGEIEERNQQLQFLATRDPLTGCLNRRSFFESFEQQWRQVRRYHVPLSCVMVDVDHFKSINDNFGHAKGDEVLRTVAAALLDAARDTDLVCRYGGEEFCILLPHVDLEGGRQAAERYRERIQRLEFEGDLRVTASLGVSDRTLGAETPEQLIEQADQCLYVAKRNGRNQSVTFPQAQAAAAESPTGDAVGENAVAPSSALDCESLQLDELFAAAQAIASDASAAAKSPQEKSLRQALQEWLRDAAPR